MSPESARKAIPIVLLHPQEQERLAQLRSYAVLDTLPEPEFDRITRTVATVLDVPICLVSLIDDTRQWSKSSFGMELGETPRELAFCSHAVLSDDVTVIPDASKDHRFCNNPLVTGDPMIRFYAGAPLIAPNGLPVGTLCAIGRKARALSDEHHQILTDLAAVVVNELELRKVNRSLEAAVALKTEALVQEKALLEQASAEKSRFLAMMSHEFRTPLNAISGFSETIQTEFLGKIENRQYVDYAGHIYDSSQQLVGIVNNILDFSKAEAKRMEITPTHFPVGAAIMDAITLVAGSSKRSRDLFTLSLNDQDLPIFADNAGLQRILINLISNADKFSTNDKPITINARAEATTVVISVVDHGCGIPAAEQDRVFEPFIQASNGKRASAGGTGLGLALTKELVDLHGGDIHLASTVGAGTTVTVTFPNSPSPN